MPTITTKDGVDIFYKDWGSTAPLPGFPTDLQARLMALNRTDQ
jgi:UDP-N-acetylglucosamine enolpyruvyl transferase